MMIKEEAVGLRFFQIIHPSLSMKMSIPPAFVDDSMGKKEKDGQMVTLVGKNGKIWHVDLYVKEKGKLFMGGDGWRQFVAANALKVGYMLVLKYTGNMVFSFRAFDRSNCETTCSTALPASQMGLRKKTSKQIYHVDENDSDSNQEPGSTQYSSKKRKVGGPRPSKTHTIPKVTTCNEAGGWFEIIIMPSHLKASPVCIPARFRESIGLAAENATANLRDPTGHTWLVHIYYRKQLNSLYMTGFHKFAKAMQLEVGDRCIFESVSQEEPRLFQVKIDKSRDCTIKNELAFPSYFD